MRMFRNAVSVFLALAVIVGESALGASGRAVTGADQGLFAYRYETGDQRYADLVVLGSGAAYIGKGMEWANQILLYGQDGRRRVYDVSAVETFLTRREPRHLRRPELADLTVGYIERLPRGPSRHGRVRLIDGLPRIDGEPNPLSTGPQPGDKVTFRIHVLNAGGADSPSAICRVWVDDDEATSAEVPPLPGGRTHVVEFEWRWRAESSTIRVTIAPRGPVSEIVTWNNTYAEPIQGLGLTAVVARDRYEAFRRVRNVVDTFCFEDWLQYQVRSLNALMAASVYPSAPDGIVERIRCDRIIVVDDPHIAPWPGDYAALAVFGPLHRDEEIADRALHVDWPMLQQVGRDLGLVDLTMTDTDLDACLVRDARYVDMYVQRRHLSPRPATFMYSPGGHLFSEASAAHLNKVRGRPRGLRGAYLYQLPETITLDVLANDGSPAADVDIDVYQLMADGEFAGAIVGLGPSDPLFSAVTASTGRVALPNQDAPAHATPGGYTLRPNPFGKIATDGSNGLLLIRLRRAQSEEFHFLRLLDCNVAYLRGAHKEYIHRIHTRFGPEGAPPPPPYTSIRTRSAKDDPAPPLYVKWLAPPDLPGNAIDEFRVYRRTSFGGDETNPWTLHRIVQRVGGRWVLEADVSYFDEHEFHGPYSLDTSFAVSTVDRLGRESGLSPVPAWVVHDKRAVGFAIDRDHQAYISIRGDGSGHMLHYNAEVGTQPYGVRTRGFDGYVPDFGGVSVVADGGLIVADPANHCLAFYERGDLTKTVPHLLGGSATPGGGPGQFDEPIDVAVGKNDRLFVADSGNDRIEIVDGGGSHLGTLDSDFEFDRPESVGLANGRLCVTDQGGTRLRVYNVAGDKPAFMCQLPALMDADRGLVSATGRVYVAARDPDTQQWAILVFAPNGMSAERVETISKAEGQGGDISRPRGLYLYSAGGHQYAYFVNRLPNGVRRILMK